MVYTTIDMNIEENSLSCSYMSCLHYVGEYLIYSLFVFETFSKNLHLSLFLFFILVSFYSVCL